MSKYTYFGEYRTRKNKLISTLTFDTKKAATTQWKSKKYPKGAYYFEIFRRQKGTK